MSDAAAAPPPNALNAEPHVLRGVPGGRYHRLIGLAVSQFNPEVSGRLERGAIDILLEKGMKPENIVVVHVPGAWELPLAARRLAARRDCAGVIALGSVIRGETAHFDYVCNECCRGLADVMQRHDKPVALGVLTTENREQALDRAGGRAGNKGADAALALLGMLDLLDKIRLF